MDQDSKINITKKNKEKTFTVESFDNNAPVKQIIDFLKSKHKTNKVYAYYCHLLRQNTLYSQHKYMHFLYPGHTLNAFSEEWDGGLNSGYFETFPYKSMMPRMITSKLRYMNEDDPVTSIMHKKNTWVRTWDGFKSTYHRTKGTKGYEWFNNEIIHCPEEYLEMAEHLEDDPDVYFDSSYNWYYAGNGNMHFLSLHGEEFLLRSELNCIYLLPFNRYSLTIEYNCEIIFEFTPDTRILETVGSQNIIAVRTKHKVTILKIIESNNEFKIEKLKDTESKLPFTGISFDEFHKNILYVTTIDHKLTIVNIDRMTGRSKQLRGKIETLVNNWSTVIGTERPYFTHVTKHYLTLYDKRTNNAFERWKNVTNIIDNATCDDITAAKYCTGKPLLYIGTNHHAFLLDMRYNKAENKTVKAVQRWTHGMQCNPTYISVCDFEHGKELVSLSSQWVEDMCILSNHADRHTRSNDIRSVVIPYRPPSVFETLNQAQEKMLCTDLNNPIEDRLVTAITGQVVFEQGDKYAVLMQNSLGDIMAHTLCPNDMMMFFEDDGCEQLDQWSKLYKKETKDFEVSYLVDISRVWKRLKKIPDTYKISENMFVRRKRSKFNEKDIIDTFEKEEIDPGLMDIWKDNTDDTMVEENKTASQLFFSED